MIILIDLLWLATKRACELAMEKSASISFLFSSFPERTVCFFDIIRDFNVNQKLDLIQVTKLAPRIDIQTEIIIVFYWQNIQTKIIYY